MERRVNNAITRAIYMFGAAQHNNNKNKRRKHWSDRVRPFKLRSADVASKK